MHKLHGTRKIGHFTMFHGAGMGLGLVLSPDALSSPLGRFGDVVPLDTYIHTYSNCLWFNPYHWFSSLDMKCKIKIQVDGRVCVG